MKQIGIVILLASMFSSPVFAQTVNPYDGTWKVSYTSKNKEKISGTLVVNGEGGTWKIYLQGNAVMAKSQGRNNCQGMAAPITVKVTSPKKLVIKVNRSKIIAGCKDSKMAFQKVDDKTLKGAFRSGVVISLTKE